MWHALPPSKRRLKLRLTNRRLREPLLSNPPQGSLRSRKLRPRRPAYARHRRTRPSIARLTRVVVGAGAGEVAVVGAVQPTRPHPPKQSNLRKTKREKSTTARTSLPTGRVAVAVAGAGGVRRPRRPLTTLRTPCSGYASPAGRTPVMRSSASTGRLGWRPSGSGAAKVVRQVGVARPS